MPVTLDVMDVGEPQPGEPTESAEGRRTSKGGARRRGIRAGWAWFTAFRRTRPFWGGLWTLLAGLWLVRSMNFGIGLAISEGWSHAAGYILGGALVLFGLVAWFAPHYKGLVGILAWLVALAAFVGVNLGGYLIGTVLGIIGGSMIWAWGEKKPKRPTGTRAREATEDGSP